jgi:hypothetical protein
MTPEEMQKIEARIDALGRQMDDIQAMLKGTLLTKRNRLRRQDGTLWTSPEHYTFQYRGANGQRKWKRIPKSAKSAVERLVREGNRYQKLEREYAALMTERALADGGKKNV